MQTYITYADRIKQNNDHTRILRIIRFRSSFIASLTSRRVNFVLSQAQNYYF